MKIFRYRRQLILFGSFLIVFPIFMQSSEAFWFKGKTENKPEDVKEEVTEKNSPQGLSLPVVQPYSFLDDDFFHNPWDFHDRFLKRWDSLWPRQNTFGSSFSFSIPQFPIDLEEKEDHFLATIDAPGLNPEFITLEVKDGRRLLIKTEKEGDKEENSEEDGRKFYYRERSFGQMQRQILLPSKVKREAVKATFKNGILTIMLPKDETPEEKHQTIPIEVQE